MNKNCFCNQTILKDFNCADEVTISTCDYDIDEIIESDCTICIHEKKVITSCNEYKLVLKGNKYIKTSYTTCRCDGRVYYSKLILPFFETITIPPCSNIKSITADVSYCDVNICKNTLWVCSIISTKIDYSLNLNNSTPKCLCIDTDKYDYDFKNDTYKSNNKPINTNFRKKTYPKNNKRYSNQKEFTRKEPIIKESINYPTTKKHSCSFDNFFDDCDSCIENLSSFNDCFSKYDTDDAFNVDFDLEDDKTDYLEAFDNEE